MTRIIPAFTILAAILLFPALAFAQTTSPTVADLVTSWGKWSIFAGVSVSLLIESWRRFKPEVFDTFSPLAKRLVPLLVAGLSAGSAVALAGASWSAIGIAAASAWGTALMAGDTLRVIGDTVRAWMAKRSSVSAEANAATAPVSSIEDRVAKPANAKAPGKPPTTDELPPAS